MKFDLCWRTGLLSNGKLLIEVAPSTLIASSNKSLFIMWKHSNCIPTPKGAHIHELFIATDKLQLLRCSSLWAPNKTGHAVVKSVFIHFLIGKDSILFSTSNFSLQQWNDIQLVRALLNIVDAVTFFFLYYIYSTEQLLSCSLKQKECGKCFNYQLDVAVTAKRSPFSPTGPEWCAEELAVWVVLCRSAATRENHLAVPLRDPAEDQPVRALLRATQCCSSSLTVESHRRLFFLLPWSTLDSTV